jgi:hypothetical protein
VHYNTVEEVERLIGLFEEVLGKLTEETQ